MSINSFRCLAYVRVFGLTTTPEVNYKCGDNSSIAPLEVAVGFRVACLVLD